MEAGNETAMRREAQSAEEPKVARMRVRTAFTLIEVLTVIALLTVLLLATLPAFRSARTTAQRHAAASEAMEIASATLEFRRIYGSWPCEEEAKGHDTVITAGRARQEGENAAGFDSYDLDIGKVVHVLIGDDDPEYRIYNPRALQFLELSRSCLRQQLLLKFSPQRLT